MANEFIIRKGFKSLQDSQITGSLNLSGDLEVLGSISGDITGSATTASYIELSNVDGSASLASRIFDNSSSIASLETVSGSYANSSSFASSISANSSSIGSLNAVSSSYLLNTTDTLTGDLTVTGNIIATTLNVQDVTASVVYSSGSNVFGSSSIDTQQFTGSILTSGSIEVNGDKFTVSGATGNATFAGDVSMGKLTATKSGTAAVFNSGTTNVVAKFTSTDATGVIQLVDSGGNVEIGASGNNFVISPAGGVAQLTVGSSNSTFAGDVAISKTGDAALTITSGTSNSAKINLGDSSNDDAGIIEYKNDSGGSDYMAFTVATTERLRINSSGGVSITPTTSTSFFYGADGTNSYINFETNNIDATVQLYAGYSSGGYFAVGTKDSGGTLAERMRIDSSGNVGIGVDPSEKLTIDGTTNGAYVRISNAASGDISSGYTIYNGSNLDYSVYTNPTFGNTTLLSREALAIRTGGSQSVFIDSSGNATFTGQVSVGNYAIPSDHQFQIAHLGQSYARFALTNSQTGNGSSDGLIFQMESLNSIIKNQENGSLGFGTNGRETDILIDSSGNSTFTGDVMPSAENLYDIGSASVRWEDIWADQVYGRSVYVDDNIYHNGDTDTYIAFTADRQTYLAGGDEFIDFREATESYITLGNSNDTDAKLIGGAGYIFIQGSNGYIGINDATPSYPFQVSANTVIEGTLTVTSTVTTSTGAEIRSSDGTGIRLRNAANSANEGGFCRSGYWEGNSSRDPSLFAETGLGLRFYTGGSANKKFSIDSAGISEFKNDGTTASKQNSVIRLSGGGAANGYTLINDTYTATESQLNIGLGYSGSPVVISQNCKVSATVGNQYLSSNAQGNTRPQAFLLDAGDFIFKNTQTSATRAVDSVVALDERMRIADDGKVSIGERSVYANGLTIEKSGNHLFLRATTATAGRYFNFDVTANNDLYIINHAGDGVYLNSGATSWSSSSDESKKENIKPLENVLDKIKDYRCVEYNLKSDKTKGKKIGFIAQDWENDFSPIVNKDDEGLLGMKYTETIPVLLKAIQEQQKMIQELKAEIEILKNK